MLTQQRCDNMDSGNESGSIGKLFNEYNNAPLTEAHFQEIVARKISGCAQEVAYEVLFRPGKLGLSVEGFYANLHQKELLNLSLEQLHQLAAIDYRHLDVLALAGHKIARLFINIEARIISSLEAELVWLKETLKQQEVELVVEITERLSAKIATTAFASIAKLHDFGVKFALDDFEPKGDLRRHWINTACVDYIKLILPRGFEKSEKVRLDFIDYIYQLKNQAQVKVIVEKVETLEQFLAMELVPYDGLQGYLFSQPEKLAQIELHRHAFG
ncbi:EAL domain-containing protein [Shewanella algae]|uniref:EAL domain-containing protein n=1 Tax=Shewanella algae TaxID=38313 RepID=UPI001AAFF661|nr:EAL domain-containing protein [Shewanella algae]MBO2622069.1 EAL domain-containing protein [Shewanella algae]